MSILPQCQTVVDAYSDRLNARKPNYRRRVRSIRSSGVSQLASEVSTPGPDSAIAAEGNSMKAARGDRRDVVQSCDLCGKESIVHRSVAKLASPVTAPRPDSPIVS